MISNDEVTKQSLLEEMIRCARDYELIKDTGANLTPSPAMNKEWFTVFSQLISVRDLVHAIQRNADLSATLKLLSTIVQILIRQPYSYIDYNPNALKLAKSCYIYAVTEFRIYNVDQSHILRIEKDIVLFANLACFLEFLRWKKQGQPAPEEVLKNFIESFSYRSDEHQKNLEQAILVVGAKFIEGIPEEEQRHFAIIDMLTLLKDPLLEEINLKLADFLDACIASQIEMLAPFRVESEKNVTDLQEKLYSLGNDPVYPVYTEAANTIARKSGLGGLILNYLTIKKSNEAEKRALLNEMIRCALAYDPIRGGPLTTEAMNKEWFTAFLRLISVQDLVHAIRRNANLPATLKLLDTIVQILIRQPYSYIDYNPNALKLANSCYTCAVAELRIHNNIDPLHILRIEKNIVLFTNLICFLEFFRRKKQGQPATEEILKNFIESFSYRSDEHQKNLEGSIRLVKRIFAGIPDKEQQSLAIIDMLTLLPDPVLEEINPRLARFLETQLDNSNKCTAKGIGLR
jgi:hypothetical protein